MKMIVANDEEQRYASVDEAKLALTAMTTADMTRLGRIAQLRAHRLPGLAWEDLVGEAIEKLLSGARRWPCGMPLTVFLGGVMRSLASEAWRKHTQAAIVTPAAERGDEADPLLQVADGSPGPERQAIARDLLDRVLRTFEGDETVQGVIEAMADGYGADEIQRRLGLSSREYETCRKRLRRGLARHFPEGL